MIAIRQTQAIRFPIIVLPVTMALIVSLVYLLINLRVLDVGDPQVAEGSSGIIYAAASGYFGGGLLILARQRWLWIFGAVMNALVIVFFLQLYLNWPAVLFSPGALVSKGTQLLLEVSLIYLILTDSRHATD